MARIRTAPRPPPSRFKEVNTARSSPEFRAYVGKALEVLKNSPTPIGKATYRYITSGKVRIDELGDLTRPDFNRARKTLAGWGVKLAKDDFERLGDKRSRAHRAVEENLTGYMWDDRIYVEPGLSAKKLAATLVHEVNHVVNRSEEHYRSDTAAFTEEYRAFYAERLFSGETMTKAKCQALKAKVAKDYGFDAARLDEVPDVPPGKLIPR